MPENKKRITLLTEPEIKDIYDLPDFNDQERDLYFHFNEDDWELINAEKTDNTKINLMLIMGYFKAKQLFFKLAPDNAQNDLNHLKEKFISKFRHKDFAYKTIDFRTRIANPRRFH